MSNIFDAIHETINEEKNKRDKEWAENKKRRQDDFIKSTENIDKFRKRNTRRKKNYNDYFTED